MLSLDNDEEKQSGDAGKVLSKERHIHFSQSTRGLGTENSCFKNPVLMPYFRIWFCRQAHNYI